MKKPVTTKTLTPTEKVKAMLAESERVAEHLIDLVAANELDTYLIGTDIRGDLVDESDDITPEQVAILGAYTVAVQSRDNLKDISEGKAIEIKPTHVHETVVAIEIDKKTGKQTIHKGGNLPPEALEALKNFLRENER